MSVLINPDAAGGVEHVVPSGSHRRDGEIARHVVHRGDTSEDGINARDESDDGEWKTSGLEDDRKHDEPGTGNPSRPDAHSHNRRQYDDLFSETEMDTEEVRGEHGGDRLPDRGSVHVDGRPEREQKP